MFRPSRAVLVFACLAILSSSFAAHAQQGNLPPVKNTALNQYPSFVEISGTTTGAQGGTQFDLRCGYSAANGRISLDPTLNDFSVLNLNDQAYSRYQNIDGVSIVTGADPAAAGGTRVIVHVAGTDGSVTAKNCEWNKNGDTITSCRSATPTVPLNQILAQAQGVASQCDRFLQKASIDPRVYSLQKTQDYKAKLEQKLAILQAP